MLLGISTYVALPLSNTHTYAHDNLLQERRRPTARGAFWSDDNEKERVRADVGPGTDDEASIIDTVMKSRPKVVNRYKVIM